MMFDVESFYDYAAQVLKDNISAKVAEINTEKDDGITLEAPRSSDYYVDFNEKVISEPFFIYYTLVEARPIENVGEDVSIEVTMMFYVAFIEIDGGDEALKKGMRYTRAFQEVFKEGFAGHAQISDLEIFQHMPQSAQFEKSSKWYKIGGIEIKGTIST